MDRLRKRCEEMLADKEQILLDAECSVIQTRLPFPRSLVPWQGAGRAFLTPSRLIWVRRATPAGLRHLIFWIPDLIEIQLSRVEDLRLIKTVGLASVQIRIRSEGKEYFYRLGMGPYPLLRRNPETAEEWFHKLETFTQLAAKTDERDG